MIYTAHPAWLVLAYVSIAIFIGLIVFAVMTLNRLVNGNGKPQPYPGMTDTARMVASWTEGNARNYVYSAAMLALTDERERCAQIAERSGNMSIAKAIRAQP